MTAPHIQMKNVCKKFNNNIVLDGINLSIQPGEKIVICGPSGAGKSTLIRTLNGLESYDSGEILVMNTLVHPMNYSIIRQNCIE